MLRGMTTVRYTTSKNIAAQSRIERGTAMARPRAKLRFRTGPARGSGPVSLIATNVLTIGSRLTLSGNLVERERDRAARRDAENAGSGSSGHWSDMTGAMGDLVLLARFALGGQEMRRRQAVRVIRLGDRRAGRARRPKWLLQLATFLLAMTFTRQASAQEAEVLTPIQLFEPEASEGVRVGGSFILRPQATAEVYHDSNIYNVDEDERSDTVFSLRPRLALQSDFARHWVELYGGADIRRYAKISDENSEAYDAGARARLELASWVNIEPEVKISRDVEQRGTAGDQFATDHPIAYTRKEFLLGISRSQHRIELALNGRISRTDYSDTSSGGVPIDLSMRDFTYRVGAFRIGYNLGSRVQVFSELSGNRLSYSSPDAEWRDSSGFSLLGGARVRVTGLLDVEAALGYIRQNFTDDSFEPIKAVNYSLAARWTPRPTWLITAGAERNVDGSPLPDVPAILRTTYKLEAMHALTNRVLLGARIAHVSEDYESTPRTDRRYEAALSVTYRLTPNVGLLASAGYRDQDGGAAGRSYDGASIGLAVRVIG